MPSLQMLSFDVSVSTEKFLTSSLARERPDWQRLLVRVGLALTLTTARVVSGAEGTAEITDSKQQALGFEVVIILYGVTKCHWLHGLILFPPDKHIPLLLANFLILPFWYEFQNLFSLFPDKGRYLLLLRFLCYLV